jgi:glycosyltransferase involved in cell wall biosynthesis
VIFHDFVATQKVAEFMAGSDLGVVPKRASSAFGNEAASTKIMEFMSLGIPVIVSRTKIDTYYHDESRVRFFESENESDLADSILLLYRDPQLRKKLASNASQYIGQNNWQEKRRDYFHLVDRLGSPRAEAKK